MPTFSQSEQMTERRGHERQLIRFCPRPCEAVLLSGRVVRCFGPRQPSTELLTYLYVVAEVFGVKQSRAVRL